MTDYAGLTLRAGVDGQVPFALLEDDGCCVDPLCTDEGQSACAFVDLLPTGPMWDRQKFEVREVIKAAGGVPDGVGEEKFPCVSMATFAVYVSQVRNDLVKNALGPTIREHRPHTAVTTRLDWLDRYQWVDCYRSACRPAYLANLSPYEVEGECGSEYCATSFPEEFEAALQHAILMSLTRLRRGIIKNLGGINWVIEPLGARIDPVQPYPEEVQTYLDGKAADPDHASGIGIDGSIPCWCEYATYEMSHTSETLPAAPTEASFCDRSQRGTVSALQTYTCEGRPDVQLYPGVVAAECIAWSLMPRPCPNIIFREDTT